MSKTKTKVWNVLFPQSGSHSFRVEDAGLATQRAFLDERPATRMDGTSAYLYLGPGGATLELRCTNKQWVLLVDGVIVEEYVPTKRGTGDESLRQLRSKPDGSYMIQTDIDASMLDLNIVRKFRFCAQGHPHEVAIAHREYIWQVVVDEKVVDRVSHKQSDDDGEASFHVKVDESLVLPGLVCMTWDSARCLWIYILTINGVQVPTSWSKAKGVVAGGTSVPEVCSTYAHAQAPPDVPTPVEGVVQHPQPLASLPQGVSFDGSTGGYQANIKSAVGRFVFLGEFATPEEAHARYLEAVPTYYPNQAH
mmetsp:Transcript_44715/g.103389  ORF Transcript_44715/g.103389 Transcript_44715/m.103389 type:complete len:307 (-) Transcript_44715:29-949(-)